MSQSTVMLGLLSPDRQTDRELTEVEVIHAVCQQNVIEHCDVRVVVSRQTDRQRTDRGRSYTCSESTECHRAL